MNMYIKNMELIEAIETRLKKYDVQIGILKNAPHYQPVRDKKGFKRYGYAGLPLVKPSSNPEKVDGTLVSVMRKLNSQANLLQRPFRQKTNNALLVIINLLCDALSGKENKQRILNGYQAVIRAPILRDEYGRNSSRWAKIKGFNKFAMFTGQIFKNIKARFVNNV